MRCSALCIFASLLISAVVIHGFTVVGNANADGRWQGQETYRIPISWCAVVGSEAADNPNIPNEAGGSDSTTDEVLWRRHERATDGIYIDRTGISFRSAILDALHTSLNFPRPVDPHPSPGSPGDLLKEPLPGEYQRPQFNALKRACYDMWLELARDRAPGVVNGLITLNIKRFVYADNTVVSNLIGASTCEKESGDLCRTNPYTGHVVVIDNYYTYLGGPGPLNYDKYDQNLGHEFGHALGLNHRPDPREDPRALMNVSQIIGPEGYVYNTLLNDAEVQTVRNNAPRIPSAEIDPTNLVAKGPVVRGLVMDNVQEYKTLQAYEDISSVDVILDKGNNTIQFNQELFGFMPESIKSNNLTDIQYWTLVNLDNNTNSGANQTILQTIGVPHTNFTGTDLILLAELHGSDSQRVNVTGTEWVLSNDNSSLSLLPSDKAEVEYLTSFLELHYSNGTGPVTTLDGPAYDTVRTTLENSRGINVTGKYIDLDRPFSVQAIVSSKGNILDSMDDKLTSNSNTLLLKDPLYPQCVVSGEAGIGGNATIQISGLPPSTNLHALLGPILVANGTSTPSGNSTIHFNIPNLTSPGYHLITVGVDDTALTADCEIQVNGSK